MTEKYFKLKVHPKSKRSKIFAKSKDAYEIWVKESAERGLANKAALALLAKELGIPYKKIILVKGATSPSKIVKIWSST
ncbi:MAG: DUF167 domain-containing protein [Elusimicrobia bacterium]|nr:DUF167 domain-containing protein [Elusimicrobiota bacterium]